MQAGDRVVSEIVVLLDNAARHGRGPVEIAVRPIDDDWAARAGLAATGGAPGRRPRCKDERAADV